MPRPLRPVRRHTYWGRLLGLLWIEEQEDAIPAAKENVPPRDLRIEAQPQNAAVEIFGPLEIVDVETGFHHACRLHIRFPR